MFWNIDTTKQGLRSIKLSQVQLRNRKECRNFADGTHVCIVSANSLEDAMSVYEKRHLNGNR